MSLRVIALVWLVFLLTSEVNNFKLCEKGNNEEDDIEDQEKNAVDPVQVKTLQRNHYEGEDQ